MNHLLPSFYQLYTDYPIIRWDNAPHFPEISTFPHHHHTVDGAIEASPLQGEIFQDLEYVLGTIKVLLVSL